jgi:hypothetical protein
MGTECTGKVSLLLTGSIREKLELMLHTNTEPIWNQTHDVELPELNDEKFIEFVEDKFFTSGKPIEERAVEYLLKLTNGHPKRTQHLAWYIWNRVKAGNQINIDDVQEAFEDLINSGKDNTDFAGIVDTLIVGDEPSVNEVKALFLLASGGSPGSAIDAHRFGLESQKATKRALERLSQKALVQQTSSSWKIVDPFLHAWLKAKNPVQILALPSANETKED